MFGVKSEWPLIIFTTFAPLSAGAWIVATVLSLSDVCPGSSLLCTGLCGGLLCVVLLASLGCSTLHLGRPLKALRAFKRLGNSAVSNEVFMGTMFAISLIVYLFIASETGAEFLITKVLLIGVALFATLFVLFQCLAYHMRTVPTWSSLSFSLEFAVIALLGGICFEGLLAHLFLPLPEDVRAILVAVEASGCLCMLFVVLAETSVVCESFSHRKDTDVKLGEWKSRSFIRMLVIVIGSIVWGYGMLAGESTTCLVVIGFMLVLTGVVIGRGVFYRFYFNVGLPRAD